MVKKGEILSQALSGVSDDLLDGARELFEKSEDDVIKTQELFRRKKQAVRKKMIYFNCTWKRHYGIVRKGSDTGGILRRSHA